MLWRILNDKSKRFSPKIFINCSKKYLFSKSYKKASLNIMEILNIIKYVIVGYFKVFFLINWGLNSQNKVII